MFLNYLKIALRVLVRQRSYTFLNVAGLTFGLAGFIIIFLILRDELSYDQNNKKLEHLFVMGQDQFYGADTFHFGSMPPPLKVVLEDDYPEILDASRFSSQRLVVKPNMESFDARISFADPEIFDMLTFDIVHGDPANPLGGVFTTAISEDLALKWFKDENPIGKVILVKNEFEVTVTSVFQNLPYNVTFRPEMIVPFVFLEKLGRDLDFWLNNSYGTFVELDPNADWEVVSEKVKLALFNVTETSARLFLHPLKDYHLHDFRYKGGDIQYVYVFAIVALAILLLACINFMNLATARSVKRAKEIGIRKAVGASRFQIMLQFFGESVLISLVSLNFAVVIVEVLLPIVNALTGKHLDIDYSNLTLIGNFISIGLITGLLAGIYPALVLSSFSPIAVLRSISNKGAGTNFRKVLVVVQFAISVTLIICTSVVYTQLNFIRDADLGISRDHVINLPLRSMVKENLSTLRTELERLPMVEYVSASTSLPNMVGSNGGGWEWEGKDPDFGVLISMTSSDAHYANTYGMQMAQGRYYDENLATDTVDRVVINQRFAELMGLGNAIGKTFSRSEGTTYEIIGVVKNFNFKSLRTEMEPLIIFNSAWDHYVLSIRVSGSEQVAMAAIDETYKKVYPNSPAEPTLFEHSIEGQYKAEEKLSNIFQYFAILAVIISCLGLYGLSTFMAEQRKKEMGIRKTMGASVAIITKMMLTDFTKWVLIANLIAWPLAWYIMDFWLDQFAYHVSFSWLILGIAALISLVISSSTVMFQSLKTATANPITALKHE